VIFFLNFKGLLKTVPRGTVVVNMPFLKTVPSGTVVICIA